MKTKPRSVITNRILVLVLVLVPPVTVDMVQSLQRRPIFYTVNDVNMTV